MIQIVSFIGAMLVMFAFTMLQIGKWSATNRVYLLFNLVGALVLFCAAAALQNVGFLILNFFWAVMTVSTWHRVRNTMEDYVDDVQLRWLSSLLAWMRGVQKTNPDLVSIDSAVHVLEHCHETERKRREHG